MACLYFVTENQENLCFVAAVSMESALSKGATLKSFEKFMDTTEGGEYLKEYGFVSPVLKGGAVYVPPGYNVFLASIQDLDKGSNPNIDVMFHVPLVIKSKASTAVTQAYTTQVTELHNTTTGTMWEERKKWYARQVGA